MYTICACESVPCVSGLRVQSAKKEQKESKIFLNFFVFCSHFSVFSSLSSLLTKKRKFFSLHKKKKTQSRSLSFALRASEYARIKDHHHGAFCDDDDMGDDANVVLFILFVFVAFISLSLSLSLRSRD